MTPLRWLAVTALIVAPHVALGDVSRQQAEDTQAASADERNTQAGADPWVASSTALFGRPSLREALKISNDADEDGTLVTSLSASVASFGIDDRWLDPLQASISYAPSSRVASFGIKYNLNLGDIRYLSDAEFDQLAERIKEGALSACVGKYQKTHPCEEDDQYDACQNDVLLQAVTTCALDQDKLIDAILKDRKARPSFSLAAGGGYDVDDRQLQKLAIEAAGEVPLGPVKLTINGDLTRSPATEMEALEPWKAGGGAQLAYAFKDAEASAGGKVLACLSDCGDASSTIQIGGQVSYHVSDDYSLSASLKWEGEGTTLDEAIAGIAMSYSFGPK